VDVLEINHQETMFTIVIGNSLLPFKELLKLVITLLQSSPLTLHYQLTLFKLIGFQLFKLMLVLQVKLVHTLSELILNLTSVLILTVVLDHQPKLDNYG